MATLRALVPALPRTAWLVLGGVLLSAAGTGLTLAYLLVYLHHARGFDLELAGLALSLLAVAGLIGNPLGGSLSDRYGPRRALLLGLGLNAVAAVWIAFVAKPWQALAAAALAGLGAAILWPSEQTLLAGVVEPEQRSSVFSVQYATMNLGFGAGAAASAAVVDLDSVRSFQVLYLVDACSFVAFALVLLALRGVGTAPAREQEERGRFRDVLRDTVFLRVWLLMALLVTVGYAQFHAAFPAYATGEGGLGAAALGLAWTANTFTVVLLQLVALKVVAGRRRTRGIVFVCAAWSAAWAVVLAAGGPAGGTVAAAGLFALAMVLLAVGEVLVAPTLPALVNDLAPDRLRGRYNGAFALAWTTGFVAGPALAAAVLARSHGSALFLGFIAALALAAVWSLALERRLPAGANRVGGELPPTAVPVLE